MGRHALYVGFCLVSGLVWIWGFHDYGAASAWTAAAVVISYIRERT